MMLATIRCYTVSMRYDFVAVGDITIDAFILLKDAEEHTFHGTRELCVRFGEKVPYEEVREVLAVGNAANAAVSARLLGLSSAFVTWLGDDENGERCRAALREKKVSDEFVVSEKGQRTNYHYVLSYGAERTILIRHENYPYRLPAFKEPPRYIYFSSISESAVPFHHELASYVRKTPEVKLVFQPGTFQIRLGAKELHDVYAVTEIFFCNKEEAQSILQTPEREVKKLLDGIHALGPRIVCITDGPKGAYIRDDTGSWYAPMYPDPALPQNRTGAGDATASTTVAYITKGLSAHEALLRGLINAASVVQHIGAQAGLLSEQEIEAWYTRRPADFIARPI